MLALLDQALGVGAVFAIALMALGAGMALALPYAASRETSVALTPVARGARGGNVNGGASARGLMAGPMAGPMAGERDGALRVALAIDRGLLDTLPVTPALPAIPAIPTAPPAPITPAPPRVYVESSTEQLREDWRRMWRMRPMIVRRTALTDGVLRAQEMRLLVVDTLRGPALN